MGWKDEYMYMEEFTPNNWNAGYINELVNIWKYKVEMNEMVNIENIKQN